MKCFSINEVLYTFVVNWTLLQFTFKNNIDQIPKFCYHEKLSIAGNCRMCLVEDSKLLKPVAACTIIIYDGMNIYTNTFKVRKAREGVLEFLLINHPLDCPICCQGGECDLQDLSEIFGGDKGRFYEDKRSVLNKNFGPFIKTLMNRCIHCTRCIRYAIEISGINSLGIIGRGHKMEISSYIEKFLDTELSGNIVDLCPVGALTSKSYSFLTRPWELQNYITINIFDIFLPKISVDVRGNDILRVLPKLDNVSCDEWICDDIRYGFDGLKLQKLVLPVVILKLLILKLSWRRVFFFIKDYFINSLLWLSINSYKFLNIKTYVGGSLDSESILLFKNLIPVLGTSLLVTPEVLNYNTMVSYLGLNLYYDYNNVKSVLLFGHNYRVTNPLVNLKFRGLFLNKKINIYFFGPFVNSNYFIKHLGCYIDNFLKIFEGKHWFSLVLNFKILNFFISSAFCKVIKFNILERILLNHRIILNKVILYQYIEDCISKISLAHFGLVNSKNKQNFNNLPILIKYFVNIDDNKVKALNSFKALTIYQGHNMDFCGNYANVVLSSSSFFETSNLYYLSVKGFLKRTYGMINSTKYVKSDLDILKAFGVYLCKLENTFCNKIFGVFDRYGIVFNNNYNDKAIFNNTIDYLFFKEFLVNFFLTSFFVKGFAKNTIISNSLNLKKHLLLKKIVNWG